MKTIYYSIIEKCIITSWVTVTLFYAGEQLMEIEAPYNEIVTTIKNELNNDSIILIEI
jgi:hypothetical protein